MKLKVTGWAKPIPIRNFDYCAYDDDIYDEGGTAGHGRSPAAAINDLREKMESFCDDFDPDEFDAAVADYYGATQASMTDDEYARAMEHEERKRNAAEDW